jgi:hypothetical protein
MDLPWRFPLIRHAHHYTVRREKKPGSALLFTHLFHWTFFFLYRLNSHPFDCAYAIVGNYRKSL